ncbi:multidrug effflux MFS transporter [Planktotalea arctica]|uniref:multidrug effflux MFS transporter n=1 Tax=Planktotalea arctica TaxID=1481893 RepID=UPI00321BFD8B
MGTVEFIAFGAMMFATIAFSIDAMLPALPQIAEELSPDAPNRAQLILTSFVLGMGIGTFITGPLSDSFGRKSVITLGAIIYCVSAFVAWRSSSLEVVLAARVMQGIGAAGPRVVTLAIIRDLHSGREMARMMSFVMMVFTLVPAVAPLMGAGIIALSGWRGIFIAFMGFSLFSLTWMHLRLPETLARENRRPFNIRALVSATKELFTHSSVRISIACQTLGYGLLFGMISSVQPIYDVTFAREASFPFWFAIVALFSGSASFLNAMLVVRFGMRLLILISFGAQIVFSALMLLIAFIQPADALYFAAFVLWQTSIFFMAGMTLGNLNALAMEPVGHIAGLAASIIGGVSTVLAIFIAAPVGLLFDGTPVPLAAATFIACMIGTALMLKLRRDEAR